jgi:hypothetical protein
MGSANSQTLRGVLAAIIALIVAGLIWHFSLEDGYANSQDVELERVRRSFERRQLDRIWVGRLQSSQPQPVTERLDAIRFHPLLCSGDAVFLSIPERRDLPDDWQLAVLETYRWGAKQLGEFIDSLNVGRPNDDDAVTALQYVLAQRWDSLGQAEQRKEISHWASGSNAGIAEVGTIALLRRIQTIDFEMTSRLAGELGDDVVADLNESGILPRCTISLVVGEGAVAR